MQGLPLYLTLARIVMSPIFLIVYLYGDKMGIDGIYIPILLLVIVGLCELSDFLDGFIARRRRKVTDLGRVLDPMADSIFRLTVFFTFTQGVIQLPLLLVLVFFFRDAIIGALRTLCALSGIVLSARKSGKIKAVVQASAAFFILILMIPYSYGCLDLESLRSMSLAVASVAAAYTVVSGGEYLNANWSIIKKYFS